MIKSKRRSLKKPALYQFKKGETYTLIISGRSKRFNIDRIILHHTEGGAGEKKHLTADESSLVRAGS